MDHIQYNYFGKMWRPSPTKGKEDCFFHSVFGTSEWDDGLYRDKYAKFRRMYWAAFLTYYSFGGLTGAFLKIMNRCFTASDKYRHKCIENVHDYTDYNNDVNDSSYWVQVEEIPILATLWNIKIVLFMGNRYKPEVFKPNPELLGDYPFRNINEAREVLICLVDKHFSRLSICDELIPIATTPLLKEFAFIPEENTKKEKLEETPRSNLKIHYNKLGSAGIKGTLYQINLLTMVLLNGLQKVEKWRLSTEDKKAAKLDDLIFEYLPSKSTILLQAKHKEDETRKITYDDLITLNSKNEFSLPKYFLSYQEVKSEFKVRKVVICTNLRLDEKSKSILKEESVDPDSVSHFEGAENLCYGFSDCSLPKLKENIKNEYYKKKQVIISDKDINDFLKHLKFFPNCLGEKNVDKIIQQTLSQMKSSKDLNSNVVQKDIHKKMTDWFKEKRGRYLTQVDAKAFFCEMRSNKYCDYLKLYDICLKKSNLPPIFQKQQENENNGEMSQQQNVNETPMKDPKRISHIIPDNEYILNVVKIYQTLPTHHKDKALFVNPDETLEVQIQIINAFEVPHYTILVMVCPNTIEDTIASDMCDRVMDILNTYKYKHVILITNEMNNLAIRIRNANINYYEVMIDNITFADLEESTQKEFKRKKLINFQGNTMSLEELFIPPTEDDLNRIVNSEILIKLARGNKTEVGLELPHKDNYYIRRSFNRNGQNIPEEDLWRSTEINKEKVVLIFDSAGMGKSTVLTSLAISIKRDNSHLWVFRFDLNNYTNIMQTTLKKGRKSVSIIDMLDSQETSKLKSEFDKNLFTTRNRVVLMLDGVDEISPTYTELVINLIRDALTQVNVVKTFVTARPHMSKDFKQISELLSFTFSENNQKKIPTLRFFALEPFSKTNQIDFLIKYWTETLDLQDDMRKTKCNIYAEALIENISMWINEKGRNNFAGIPLQTRMLAEIFQEENKIHDDKHEWEGCKEFSVSDNGRPKLPIRVDLTQLYEMFIDKKRDIFINEKSNPSGRIGADDALKDHFEKCQEFHRALALKVIFESDKWNLFTSYTNIKWANASTFINNYLLKIGIIQVQERTVGFIHRTFAEYFVAECLLIELRRTPVNGVFQKFFMDFVIVGKKYYVIRAFLDSFMRNELHLMENTFHSHFRLNHISARTLSRFLAIFAEAGCARILESFIKCISEQQNYTLSVATSDMYYMHDPLSSAIHNGHFNILGFLIELNETFNVGNDAHKDFLQYAMMLAINSNNIEMLKFLMEVAGGNINTKDNNGWTVLHVTAFQGKLEVVKFLVEKVGADKNIKDNDGWTALHVAAYRGELEIVKFLVQRARVDINIEDNNGWTALHAAAFQGKLEVVRFLVDEIGVDKIFMSDKTVLPEAAARGQLEVVEFLVEKAGVDKNIKGNDGWTALHRAACGGKLEVVKFLVKKAEADINIKDSDGWTALHKASYEGELEIVKFLMEKAGANMNDKDNDGWTALHRAAFMGRFEVVKFLVEKAGADLNIKDGDGYTVFHRAVYGDKLELVKFLTEKAGANINVKDNDGRTVLHRAAFKGQFEVVKLLVEKTGTDVNIKDNYGWTALHSAAFKGRFEVVGLLVEQGGADKNIKNNQGRTALWEAADQGHWEVVKFLSSDWNMLKIKAINFFRGKSI